MSEINNPFELTSGIITSGYIGDNAVVSGSIASGQVTHYAVGPYAITSGQVGSGAVTGSLAGGAFNIASGTIGPNDIGSGAVQSAISLRARSGSLLMDQARSRAARLVVVRLDTMPSDLARSLRVK